MNGRIYDPLLGRFLSADVLVDGVTDLQGYNRYTYVGNNPLTKTDPTGFWQFTIGGAYGIGARITFGKNADQWNFGLTAGIGLGVSASFSPKDNLVGRVNAEAPKPEMLNPDVTNGKQAAGTLFDSTTIASSVGARLLADTGAPELVEFGGSYMVNVQANEADDVWFGTTVEYSASNMLLGGASGEAWAGAKWDDSEGTLTANARSASQGWQVSAGSLLLIGVDCAVWGEPLVEATKAPSEPPTPAKDAAGEIQKIPPPIDPETLRNPK